MRERDRDRGGSYNWELRTIISNYMNMEHQGKEQTLSDMDVAAIDDFERAARSAYSVQLQLLSSILAANAGSEYLLGHGLKGQHDALSFKTHIPVVEYEDVEPYIRRIADGDKSAILCCEPINAIMLSSGTSAGKPRMIPATQKSRQILSKRFLLSNALLNREFPETSQGKTLYFSFAGKLLTTQGGLSAATSSTLHLRSGASSKALPYWTSPMGVVLGPSISESMYCHLLCGLLQAREVTVISSFLAYTMCEAFRMLEEAWQELCNDIRMGMLSARVTDQSVRADVLKLLHPDPELADKIESECSKNLWFGVMKRLWPNVRYIHTIVTGSMEPYVPYLKHYAGGIPIVCGDYGSSECSIGMNMNIRSPPEQVSFTLIPYTAYFEFLPLIQKQESAPVDITGVRVGEEYELVVTTLAGLYRYKLGDVVRVTGFYHELPQFMFVQRTNVLLSINTDKTDEREIYIVINRAHDLLREGSMDLFDFTTHADHSSRPGHYTIFWELKSSVQVQDSVLHKCCKLIDSSLNNPYQRGRAAGTIGPLRLCMVKEGTFHKIMELAVASGASPIQYKTPRCINSPDVLDILRGSVIHVCQSV